MFVFVLHSAIMVGSQSGKGSRFAQDREILILFGWILVWLLIVLVTIS